MKVLFQTPAKTPAAEGTPSARESDVAGQVRARTTADAERASKQLLHQADPMQARPSRGGNAAAPIFVASGDRPFLPKPDKIYQTTVEWNGEQRTVKFSVDREVAEFMKMRGQRVDLAKLEIVGSDNKRRNSILDDAGWQTTVGRVVPLGDASPHLKKEPILATKLVVHSEGRAPDGQLKVGVDVEDFAMGIDVFHLGERTKPRGRSPSEAKRMLEPLPIAERDLARKQLGEGIEVTGVSQASIDSANPAIDAVLGKSLARWPEIREAMKQELAALKEQQRAMESGSKAANEEEYGAVCARIGELQYKLLPIEIVVVPKDKHLSAMPQGDHLRKNPKLGELGVNCFKGVEDPVTGEPHATRLVFIPEDDASTQRHELHHVLELVVFTPEQIGLLDVEYAASVLTRGPFGRPYGMQRLEFYTTWAELFEGDGGADGLRYLEKNKPAILDLIRDVTGR